jgi:acetate kinase
LPPAAYRYAVPTAWYEQHGVRRYGFHGTSHDYVSTRAAEVLGRPRDELDLIVAHLGNGASITAVEHGRSVETSMGLSPLEGLVMGTRSGDIDPAVIGHVAAASGQSEADVLAELNRSSGLLGLCGDSDMREITGRIAAGPSADAAAADLALDVFCHRLRKYVGAYVAVLGGCDALVFTAGIGEHSALVRARVCAGLGVFGIALDDDRNERSELVISRDDASTAVLVVPTDEEHAIAEQTARVVEPG